MYPFDYNRHGQVQTGFENSIDHSTFGHWRNPEYQEMCQSEEESQRGVSGDYPDVFYNSECECESMFGSTQGTDGSYYCDICRTKVKSK